MIPMTKPVFPWDCLEDSPGCRRSVSSGAANHEALHEWLAERGIKPITENRSIWEEETERSASAGAYFAEAAAEAEASALFAKADAARPRWQQGHRLRRGRHGVLP